MRILLTGCTGFIGRPLGLELTRRGHEIVALVRNVEKTNLPFPAELHAWDSPTKLKDIDAVIHLAGESIAAKRWSAAQKKKIVESRTLTTASLLEKLRAGEGRKPGVLVSASGVGYYGDRGDEILTEASDGGVGFLSDTCRAWEGAVSGAKGFIPRVAWLRTGIVLGRGGGALAAMLPLFKTGLGGRLGNGRQWMSWIHLDDIVNLYVAVTEGGQVSGAVNAVAPHPVTNAEFTKALAAQLKMPAILPAPAFALKLALGEMSALLLESQRATAENLPPDFKFRYAKIGEALGAVFKGVEKARGPLFHEHVSQAWVPAAPEKVFAFLADPAHLPKCAPPEYALKVESLSTVRLAQNSMLVYSFRALGMRFTVRALYLDWVENHRYSTTHQRGPCAFWHHVHSFERMGSGTLITERLIFRLRFHVIGSLLGERVLANRLARAFSYRSAAIKSALKYEPAATAPGRQPIAG